MSTSYPMSVPSTAQPFEFSCITPTSYHTTTEPIQDIKLSSIVLGISMLGDPQVASSSAASLSTKSPPENGALPKRLYECPLCHSGEEDENAKAYIWTNQASRVNVDAPGRIPQWQRTNPQSGKLKRSWKRPTCLQKHIARSHIWFFKEKGSEDFIYCFCPCHWHPGCDARFKCKTQLINHISEHHSVPFEPHYRYDHFCGSALIDSI